MAGTESKWSRPPKIPHLAIVRAPGLFCMPYTLSELSAAVGIPVRTLTDWTKQGMPHRQDRSGARRIWVVGTEFADWIAAVRRERKKSAVRMAENEVYCLKCRKPVPFEGPPEEVDHGKTRRRTGRCSVCGGNAHRVLPLGGNREAHPSGADSNRTRVQVQRPVSRENFGLVEAFMRQHVDQSYNPKTRSRYSSYLRHMLLWAGTQSLTAAQTIQPDLLTYLDTARQDGSGIALQYETQKKVMSLAHDFFLWLKTEHSQATRRMPTAWVNRVKAPRSKTWGSRHMPNTAPSSPALPLPAPEHNAVTEATILAIAALEIPENQITLRRDQAAACCLYASGMRASAFCTLPIRAFDRQYPTVAQLRRYGVQTKNGKEAVTTLLQIPELLRVILNWDEFIRACLPDSAMWFTPLSGNWGDLQLAARAPGPSRQHQLIKALKRLYGYAGLPYQRPHAHRHGHAVWALQHARSLADYKAISQNLMHGDLFITDRTYATFSADDVSTRIRNLHKQPPIALDSDRAELAAVLGGTATSELLATSLLAIIDRRVDGKVSERGDRGW